MNREVALKILLAFVGLLFLALAYPLMMFVRQDPALSIMFSIYVTLGVFLLLAIRDGVLKKERREKRRSYARSRPHLVSQTSRTSSCICVRPPNSKLACLRASAAGRPDLSRSLIRRSR